MNEQLILLREANERLRKVIGLLFLIHHIDRMELDIFQLLGDRIPKAEERWELDKDKIVYFLPGGLASDDLLV